MSKTLAAILAFVTMGLLVGCASSPDAALTSWRGQVEQYIDQQGGGNPNVIRNLSDDPVRKQFNLIGPERGAVGPTRTDIHGVIVAHTSVAGRPWFVFLVGVVKYDGGFVDVTFDNPHVLEIRPAAFTVERDRAMRPSTKRSPRITERSRCRSICWYSAHSVASTTTSAPVAAT